MFNLQQREVKKNYVMPRMITANFPISVGGRFNVEIISAGHSNCQVRVKMKVFSDNFRPKEQSFKTTYFKEDESSIRWNNHPHQSPTKTINVAQTDFKLES